VPGAVALKDEKVVVYVFGRQNYSPPDSLLNLPRQPLAQEEAAEDAPVFVMPLRLV